MKISPFTIGIVGPIGVGKSTLSILLAKRMGMRRIEEKFPKNPFLEIFYKDPKRWSFNSQVHFLLSKIDQLRKLDPKKSYILDPCLEMDIVYALTQQKMGWMDSREKSLYIKIARILKKQPGIRTPDVILRLHAPPKVLKKRILKRKRPYEMKLIENPPIYLRTLDRVIDEFVSKDKTGKTIDVDVSKDTFTNNSFMRNLEGKIIKKLK